jgi:hypothetical protein
MNTLFQISMKRSPSSSASPGAAPDVLAVVVEDLGAGAAGAGVAHHPEVVGGVAGALVVADADHALGRHADFLGPDVVGLVVLGIHGDGELVLGQLEDAGEQLPGVVDRVALEVVAEAEVAQHLEEGVVAGGVADVLEVVVLAAGAHAFLRGGGAGVGALVEAEEDVLELVHACVGEQQGRVFVGHASWRLRSGGPWRRRIRGTSGGFRRFSSAWGLRGRRRATVGNAGFKA